MWYVRRESSDAVPAVYGVSKGFSFTCTEENGLVETVMLTHRLGIKSGRCVDLIPHANIENFDHVYLSGEPIEENFMGCR